MRTSNMCVAFVKTPLIIHVIIVLTVVVHVHCTVLILSV